MTHGNTGPSIYNKPNMDAYRDAQWAVYLDSYEGVPELPAETPAPRPTGLWQRYVTGSFAWVGSVLPGLALALGVAVLGGICSGWIGVDLLGFKSSPISGIMLAIVLGLLIRNIVGLPAVYEKGLRLCIKQILRIGIALLGIRLSLVAAGMLGIKSLPIVLVCIVAALVLVSRVNKLLGLPARLGTLIAVGTSICGATAIVATGGIIDAEDDEVSYSVACITIFGLLAMFTYPFLAHWLFAGDALASGLFLGTSVHETAQVAGAGMMYQEQYTAAAALDSAVVTKLVRNLCMIWVIPLMAVLYHRRGSATDKVTHWYQMVPLFVVGFLMMSLIVTVGDKTRDDVGKAFWVFEPATWKSFVSVTKDTAEWCLMLAMAAVGLGTSLRRLHHLGWKPFTVGLVAALLVGLVSLVMIKLTLPWIA